MGCTNSTEARRDMVWAHAGRRATRSFSLPSVDRQRLRWKAASVLSTLGLSQGRHSGAFKYAATSVEEMMKSDNDHATEAAVPVQEAAAAAAAKRVVKPRTPMLTPPNEPEVINAWELMAGLEDDPPTPCASHGPLASPPPWMQADADMPIALEFDPEIISGFREALADTSPSEPTSCSVTEEDQPAQREKCAETCDTPVSPATGDMQELSGIVRARINAFQEKIERRSSKGSARGAKVVHLRPPGGEKKAVVYFTSLRGVRKTFVDCCAVRSILRSYGVRVDERDVSMHAVFRAELAELLGPGFFACAALPRVFVDGRYLGGADDVHALHEAGELARALEGCEAAPVRKLGYMEACAACGDVRFVPCETCYGSCKVFVDDDGSGAGEFRRCPDCNENGLIRCPVCCC
uniref:Glutaredoxin domain-containing protein n=1 Tax=Oryza brachyantha TaxID=4533 RepID=J3M1V6_ORYBR